MTVSRYGPEDFWQIEEWGRQWGAIYRADQLPGTGFIIHGVGAYFLYSTDSTVCWLENMITRKNLSEEIKADAINRLIDAAVVEAKRMGFKIAYATTGLPSMAKRAKDIGSSICTNQFFITKDLTKSTHLQ